MSSTVRRHSTTSGESGVIDSTPSTTGGPLSLTAVEVSETLSALGLVSACYSIEPPACPPAFLVDSACPASPSAVCFLLLWHS
jgi:hypothetical protein